MKELKTFKDLALSGAALLKITGGTGGSNQPDMSEDVPITNLGTIANEGEG